MKIANPIISKLVELDTLKTWSVIVTLFGDLDGEELSGTQIRVVLSPIGVKPEAIRVALHRLKTDGWVASTKIGREAIYRLTPRAKSETASVAPDVYRKSVEHADSWLFQLVAQEPASSEAILLNKNLVLVPAKADTKAADSFTLIAQSQTLPDWVATSLVPEKLHQLAGNLQDIVGRYCELECDLDKQVFRLLVLHHWRRIALRNGAWAHASFVPDGNIARCQKTVLKFLGATKRISADAVLSVA